MSSSSPLSEMGGNSSVIASDFVDDGEILIAKLTSTLLGSVWITFVSGWITLQNVIATIALTPINALSSYYARILNGLGSEIETTSDVVWAEALRSAVEISPVMAPLLLTAEVAVLVLILAAARRRWGI